VVPTWVFVLVGGWIFPLSTDAENPAFWTFFFSERKMFRYDSLGHKLSAFITHSIVSAEHPLLRKYLQEITKLKWCRLEKKVPIIHTQTTIWSFSQLHQKMKKTQDHLKRNMILAPVTRIGKHMVDSWKQVFNARNKDYYESKYHQQKNSSERDFILSAPRSVASRSTRLLIFYQRTRSTFSAHAHGHFLEINK